MSLAAGQYSLGSGNDDDIQIIDVSLKADHLKLRISPGKIEIGATTGSLRSANGIVLEADSDWQEVEPLDVITAGTTRFALGPPTALWASITEIDAGQPAVTPARKRPKAARPKGAAAADPTWTQRARLAVPATALVALAIFSVWYLSAARIDQFGFARGNGLSDLELTTAAVAQFPFARGIDVRQEVDGTIYVNGYVETPVERRAVAGAVEKTAIPARVRIWVLQTLRSEVDNLAKSENLNVTSTISNRGELALEGVVLSEETATKFVDLAKDRILGIARIDNRIKTSKMLLGEVEKLAQVSQIYQWVLLRDNRELIEANGAVPIEKIDAWAGFLQAYARRFAKDIGLRSYVQLQNVSLAQQGGRDQAFVIGGQTTQANEIALDVERLKQGNYAPKDVLIGAPGEIVASAGAQRDALPPPASEGALASDIGPLLVKDDARLTPPVVTIAAADGATTASIGAREAAPTTGDTVSALRPGADSDLTVRARKLLEEWRENGLKRNSSDEAFRQALERLQRGEKAGAGADLRLGPTAVCRPLSSLVKFRRTADSGSTCWPESTGTEQSAGGDLLARHVLSVSDSAFVSSRSIRTCRRCCSRPALNPKRAHRLRAEDTGRPARRRNRCI